MTCVVLFIFTGQAARLSEMSTRFSTVESVLGIDHSGVCGSCKFAVGVPSWI